MASDTNSPGQIISLPKGGGALRGIGETFSPDPQTGTGNFTIPINVPPGRNGFQPQLNLVYSTGSGNGPFGLGWALSIPGVARKTSDGIPRYRDDSSAESDWDVFLVSGAEDLVPVALSSGTPNTFRPRTEGLFAEIIRVRDAGNDYWQVRSKDGLASRYGTEKPAGPNPWVDEAVISDPSQPAHHFSWKLTRTVDLFGNEIVYHYQRDTAQEGGHHWDQLYLSKIEYVNYVEDGTTKYLVSVIFDYADRPDAFSDYRSGFEIRTRKRCKSVQIATHAGQSRPVRTYQLTYVDQRIELLDQVPHNQVSLLSQIKVWGHDDAGAQQQELPPLEFSYSQFRPQDPHGRDFYPVKGSELPAVSLSDQSYDLVDLFGNGLADVLEMNETVRYWRNLGNGTFDIPRLMDEAPAGVRLSDVGVQLLDANGDGRPDLLVATENFAGYFPLNFTGEWDKHSFQAYDRSPSFSLKDPEVRLIDLDGDGITDVLRSGTRMECFFNDRQRGWLDENTRRVARKSLDVFPDVNFSDDRIKIADMSGDGLQDIVFVHDGTVRYWPNYGHGNWGGAIDMHNSPRFPYDYDPKRILIGDVDGDGLADIIYVDNESVTLWINRAGNSWSDGIEISGTASVSNMDSVRLADLLGSSISGVFWTRDATVNGRDHYFFLDLTSGTKPYLLTQMDNHMGAMTRVQYGSSTQEYLRDQQLPATRWKTVLPFPVQVVTRVEVVDDISKGRLTTEYKYHHGYWDGDEREFRGFGMVELLDTESFQAHSETDPTSILSETQFSPPVLTRTWFHLGPVEDARGEDWHEMDWSKEWWSGDPALLGHKAGIDTALQNISSTNYRLTRRGRRDALRSLRGSVLRTEMYAMDGMALQSNPYTVTENAYEFVEVANPLDRPELRMMFFPHLVVQRTTQWERGDDPLTQFTFTDDYDDFGQPRQQTNVAAPRRSSKRKPLDCFTGTLAGDAINETALLATHTRTLFATPDAGLCLYDRVSQVRSFELSAVAEVVENSAADVKQVLQDQWSAAQNVRDDFQNALRAWQPGQALPASVRLLSHVVNHYDGAAFVGRTDGGVGPYGASTRNEALIFTDAGLKAAFETGFAQTRRPAYLGGAAVLPLGAPAGFGTNIGYTSHADEPAGYHSGYYADTKRQQFDFQDIAFTTQRGLLVATKDPRADVTDPLDRTTQISYDVYGLLPVRIVDPVGLEITAEYSYRVLQPSKRVDANGNATYFIYSPAGLLQKQWLLSRDGTEGGSETKPENEYSYDFLRYDATRNSANVQPVFVHTRQRERHALDPLDANPPDALIETREFSDGFGRVIQKRTQADDVVFGLHGGEVGLPLDFLTPTARDLGTDLPAANGQTAAESVVVSEWQIYDNKGRSLEKYEPFYSTGWDFDWPLDMQLGVKVTMFYDPRGQLIRSINPDRTEQRILLGVPGNLNTPDAYDPTPWETYIYDATDLGSLAPSDAATVVTADPSHLFSPSSQVVDALGRVRCSVQRNGPNANDVLTTQSTYDIRGNLLSVTDSLGRQALSRVYDQLNHPLRISSIDAGDRTSLLDALGNLVEYRDSKESVVLREYDAMNRLTHFWALNDSAQTSVTLRQSITYGDSGSRAQASADRDSNRALNRLGKPAQHYDEAGLSSFSRYDFKGNLIEKSRRVVSDAAIANGWTAHWSDVNADADLDPVASSFQTNSRFDAMNRPIEVVFPQEAKLRPGEASPHRAKITPHYNRSGALRAVELDGSSYVSHIAHNAKGQRALIAYGNGILTRYVYDPKTFKLGRLRSEKFQVPAANSWQGTDEPLQDYTYRYDPAGNVVSIEERVRSCGVDNSPGGRDRLVRNFAYDAIYRLLSATGRACIDRSSSFLDFPNCGSYQTPFVAGAPVPNQDNAPSLTELYTESYSYDPSGNMLELDYDVSRPAGPVRLWARRFGMGNLAPNQWRNASTNRLTSLTVDGTTYNYAFDDNGNLRQENLDTFHTWDHADRMIAYRVQAGPTPSVEARYLYGADGTRVKKWVRTNGAQPASSVYIDEVFEYHTWLESGDPTSKQNNYLHVMNDKKRIAVVQVGDRNSADAGPPVQFHFGDHLDSSAFVLDDTGNWVNREEFFAYGETSLGSFARKRFRFTGKERDEESGLSYHGARYYAPWRARWLSCDPLAKQAAPAPYQYAVSNPLKYLDSSGMDDEPSQAQQARKENLAQGVYSSSPEGAQKKEIDLDIAKEGIKVDLHNADYWREYIQTIAPGKLHVGEPSPEGYQLFYIKGGFEGFLGRELKGKDADKTFFDSSFDNADVNDALVVFDPSGEHLIGAMQTVRPLGNRFADSEFAEWEAYSHGVYAYRNTNFAGDPYNGLAVMSIHKMSYKNDDPASPKELGAWVDMHDVAAGTLGCIGIATASMSDFNKTFSALRQFDADLKSSSQTMFFQGNDNQWHLQDFPGHKSSGKFSVLSMPKRDPNK
jgi:RHS repeat-associated protein